MNVGHFKIRQKNEWVLINLDHLVCVRQHPHYTQS